MEVGEEGSRVFSLCRDPGRGCHQEGPVSPAEPQQSPDSHQALGTSAPVSQLQRPSPGPPAKTTRASSWGVEAEKGFPKADAERHPDLRLGPLCCPETRTLEAPPSFRLAPLSPPRSLLGSTWPTGQRSRAGGALRGLGSHQPSPVLVLPLVQGLAATAHLQSPVSHKYLVGRGCWQGHLALPGGCSHEDREGPRPWSKAAAGGGGVVAPAPSPWAEGHPGHTPS